MKWLGTLSFGFLKLTLEVILCRISSSFGSISDSRSGLSLHFKAVHLNPSFANISASAIGQSF
uniref:Uncharacterized protein n=1 Tax=Arundo donax TaxID=35708 RepID=A0A0A8YWW9_ARUDO